MNNKSYLLQAKCDQGGVNNLHDSKSFKLYDKEQIIDSSRERGRCVVKKRRDAWLCVSLPKKNNTDSP